MEHFDRDSVDDVAMARTLARRSGCGAYVPWSLLLLTLLAGGGAGYYSFRRYDRMRATLDALQYTGGQDHERAATALARAREAEAAAQLRVAEVERQRAALDRAREDLERDRAALQTERARLLQAAPDAAVPSGTAPNLAATAVQPAVSPPQGTAPASPVPRAPAAAHP